MDGMLGSGGMPYFDTTTQFEQLVGNYGDADLLDVDFERRRAFGSGVAVRSGYGNQALNGWLEAADSEMLGAARRLGCLSNVERRVERGTHTSLESCRRYRHGEAAGRPEWQTPADFGATQAFPQDLSSEDLDFLHFQALYGQQTPSNCSISDIVRLRSGLPMQTSDFPKGFGSQLTTGATIHRTSVNASAPLTAKLENVDAPCGPLESIVNLVSKPNGLGSKYTELGAPKKEKKRHKFLEKKRASGRRSRLRQKMLLDTLRDKVNYLHAQNKILRAQQSQLSQEHRMLSVVLKSYIELRNKRANSGSPRRSGQDVPDECSKSGIHQQLQVVEVQAS